MGAGLLRPPDRRRLARSSSTSPPGSSARAACTSTTATSARSDGAGFSASIVDLALYVVNNHQRAARAGASIVLYLPKIQTAEEAALWNDMLDGARAAPRAADRHDQGLRARRADRGVLPADGDPRRARPPLRRLQHRALGLHQQRRRRDGVGSGVRQPEHRRDHDDLRLHAELRGSRAPRREHARSQRPLRAVAGRHGAEHPGRLRGGRRRRHDAGGRRRRARAARGRERQVGRALEDGAHRPAGVGEGRRRTTSSDATFPPLDLHAGGRRRADAARAGAAHRSRRPRSAERRAAVRQRLRAGLAGRGAQAGRLLRQRRRALSDGGHGDRRDPPEHPLGMAAQGRALTEDDAETGVKAGDRVHAGAVRAAARRGIREAAGAPATATSTTTRRRPRCRSPARSSRPT